MLKWNNKKLVDEKKKITYRQRIIGFIYGLTNLYQNILVKNFHYMSTLRKHLYNFQVSSSTKFIDINNYDEDNLCQICLMPLVGPCSTFACDCRLTLHEGCMFRLILGGFNECPQCKLQLSLEKYRPHIHYPRTLKHESIQRELKVIIDDETCRQIISIDKIINSIKNDCVIEAPKLKDIYLDN